MNLTIIRNNCNRIVLLLSVSLLLAAVPAAAAPPAPTGDDVVLRWDSAFVEAIRTSRTGPTVAARALAIGHTAMFDAWAAYDATADPTRSNPEGRRPAAERTIEHKATAISFAAHTTGAELFPAQKQIFDDLLGSLGYQTDDATIPARIGSAAAQAVLDARVSDGSNQQDGYADTSGYQPRNSADSPSAQVDLRYWQPLPGQQFLTPHWGTVRPFALSSGSQFRPSAPPSQNSGNDKFQVLMNQTKKIIDANANLTDAQKMSAEFWAFGEGGEPPPAQWALLAQWVSRDRGYSLDDDVTLFFALSNGLFDTSIAVWDTKRAYDSIRPITAIRKLYQGQAIPTRNGGTVLGQDWTPYIPTPPFAEYTSGHTAFSNAAAEILTKFATLKGFPDPGHFGYSRTFAKGSSVREPNVTPAASITLSWTSFDTAANDAGLSRLYGGIHIPTGDRNSRELGRSVADVVWPKALAHINGTAVPG
jgi:hypothetical protein